MWKITGASIPGSDHTMPGKPGWKNNQDAFYTYTDSRMTIGIVADGCGSGKHSEVGSKMGACLLGEMLRQAVVRSLDLGNTKFVGWERLRMNLLGQISVVANSMGGSLSSVVGDYFLFSIVGFLILSDQITVFHCGDGSYLVNGEVTKLGPFPGNAPPYISYSLLGESNPSFQIVTTPTDTVSSIVIGTDGVDYIEDLVPTLSGWARINLMFINPDMLRRQLAIRNVEKVKDGVLTPGPLKDDTTLILAYIH